MAFLGIPWESQWLGLRTSTAEGTASAKGQAKKEKKGFIKKINRHFLGGPVAKTFHSQCRGPGLIPGQETRSHMLQLRPSATK